MKNIQLNLFKDIILPEIEDLTINDLHEFLKFQYPEMKFIIKNNYYSDGSALITQTLSKKIDCYFHIGKYAAWVKRNSNKYIGFTYGKNYGDYLHSGRSADSIDEFKNKLPEIIQYAKNYLLEYNKKCLI